MVMATSFVIAQTWKQPRCPSIGEWINKLWYLQTTEKYSTIERNRISSDKKPQRHIISIVYHAHTNNNYDNREHSLSIYLQQEQ